MERSEVPTLPLTVAGEQNNAWPLVGFAVALNHYSRLWSSEDKDERRRPRGDLTLEPSSTSNQRINFKTRAHSKTPRRSRAATQMSSENDSDVPEHISLSTSKRQVIRRQKDVARDITQTKLKRKQHNRERDRQLKEQSSRQRAEPLANPVEEDSAEENEEAKDSRLLPDHLFVAAFNRPLLTPEPSVPKNAPLKTQQRKRKRAGLTPKDRIMGQAFFSPSKDTRLTLVNSSRIVRTLAKAPGLAATKRTLPSSSVSKFSARALNTKGTVHLNRIRGWQRTAGECAPRFP